MTCSLAAITACFSLANVYVEGGISAHDNAVEQWAFTTVETRVDTRFERYHDVEQWSIYRHQAANPYGSIALGYQVELSSSITADLRAAHWSSLATTKDRGDNFISLSVRWFPWGGAR